MTEYDISWWGTVVLAPPTFAAVAWLVWQAWLDQVAATLKRRIT